MGIATAGIPVENSTGAVVAAGSVIAALLADGGDGSVPIPPIIVDALMESSRSGRPLGTILEDYARSEAEAVDAAIESLVAMSHSSDEEERQCANRLIAQIGFSTPWVKNFKMRTLKDAEEKYGDDLYPYVKDYLNDPDTDVQIYAIELLGRVSKWDSDAIDQLKRIKNSSTSARVKEVLDSIIHSLEGRKPGGIPEAGFYVSASAPATVRFPFPYNVGNIIGVRVGSGVSGSFGFTGSFGYRLPFGWRHCSEPPPGWSTKSCHDEYSQLRFSGNLTYERSGGEEKFTPNGGEWSDSHDIGGYLDVEYLPLGDGVHVSDMGGGLVASIALLGTGQFKQALLSLLNFSVGYKRAYIDDYAVRYDEQEILQIGYKMLRMEDEFGHGFGVGLAFLEPYYMYLLNHKKEIVEGEVSNEREQKHDWGLDFFSIKLFLRSHNR